MQSADEKQSQQSSIQIKGRLNMKSVMLSPKEERDTAMIVGQLFLNFGTLEFYAFLLLYEFGNPTHKERVFNMKISERIKDIEANVHNLKISEEKRKCIVDSFKELKTLSIVRNTVAHGPYMIQGNQKGFMDVKASKGKIPGEITITTLKGLEKANKQLVNLFEKLKPIMQELLASKPSPSN
jgi:hypothetical protein